MLTLSPFRRPSAILLITLTALGCSHEEFSQLVDETKKQAGDVATSIGGEVTSAVAGSGRIELTVGQPLETDACYAKFISQQGRSSVLQLQSYASAEEEGFPSVFLQAQVDADSPDQLAGKVLSGRLFVQREADGSVFFSQFDNPVRLQIESVGMQVKATVSGSLHDTSTSDGDNIPVSGEFAGVLQ